MSFIPQQCETYRGTDIEVGYETVILEAWISRRHSNTAAEETREQTAKLNDMYYYTWEKRMSTPSKKLEADFLDEESFATAIQQSQEYLSHFRPQMAEMVELDLPSDDDWLR